MKAVLFVLLFLPVFCISQQQNEWLEQFESAEYLPENNIRLYQQFQFETLLVPRSDFIGYIGEDYQRIQINYTSVTRLGLKYSVKGNSIVKNHVNHFEGEIIFNEAKEISKMHFGLDKQSNEYGFQTQGVIIGSYNFYEDSSQSFAGVFEGKMALWWYIDRHGLIKYDRIEYYSDTYKNNQYVGTWTSYATGKTKVCNWGEYRIPFSGDLDIGAAEFSVNPKYISRGWENYPDY